MNLYWINAEGLRLAIVARPRGRDWLSDDIDLLKKAGIDILVSTLTLAETDELGLMAEENCCRQFGTEFVSFPIEDRSVPTSLSEFEKLLNFLGESLATGKGVAIHCRAGIGRSSLVVASLLIRNGLSANAAFLAIEKARGSPVPDTPDQRRWVEGFSLKSSPP